MATRENFSATGDSREARSTQPCIGLTVQSGFQLMIDGDPVRVLGAGERLLALLALCDNPIHRTHVSGVLWGSVPEKRAAGNLRSTLWRLPRRDIPIVGVSSTHVWLSPAVEVDVHVTLAKAGEAQTQHPGSDTLGVDERVFTRDLLPGWYEDWVVIERERLRQVRLHALERLAELRSAHGDHVGAIRAAMAAITEEPLRESPHRLLIQAHLAEGNRSEAIRQYRSYKALLEDELHERPSPAMSALIGGIE